MSTIIDLLPLELIAKITLSVDVPKDSRNLLLSNKIFRQSISETEIRKIKESYQYRFVINKDFHLNKHFLRPMGIAVGEDSVFIVDNKKRRIKVFSPFGKFTRAIGGKYGSNNLLLPNSIAVTKDGHVIVTNRNALDIGKISVFDKKGKYISRIGITKYCIPEGICVNSEGHIIVADSDNRIVIFKSIAGNILHIFDAVGPVQNVCIDKYDNIIAADHIYSHVKTFIGKGRDTGKNISRFTVFRPLGICVDPRNNNLVICCETHLSIWSDKEKFLRRINLPANPNKIAMTNLGQAIITFDDKTVRCIQV